MEVRGGQERPSLEFGFALGDSEEESREARLRSRCDVVPTDGGAVTGCRGVSAGLGTIRAGPAW